MKTTLLTTILFSSATLLINQAADAQTIGQVVTKNIIKDTRSSNYMAITDFSAEGFAESKKEIVKEAVTVSSLYANSEQFVFDNLNGLKKMFSVGDIYFDLDKAEIREDAKPVLDGLVNLMIENPGISVAATAHTDTRFSAYNTKLSRSRAQAAIDYLISKGIGADRLMIEKHGRPAQANPCNGDPSCSLATQQLNRRTEFNVVYNGVNLGSVVGY